MSSLIRVAFVASFLAASAAHAQVPDATGSCVANCGGGSSSSGPSDAQIQESIRAEKADAIRIDAENAARANRQARIHAIRKMNEDGVAAYRKKQWALAVAYFQGALRVDPNDALARRNLDATNQQIAAERASRDEQVAAQRRAAALEQARRANDAEQHRLARILAAGPVVPPPSPSSMKQVDNGFTAAQLPLAMPRVDEFVTAAKSAVKLAVIRDGTAAVRDALEVALPQGEFFRVMANVDKLAEETIPKLVSEAATGNAVPESVLGLRGATVVLNTGTGPGDALQRIAVIGSADKVFLDLAEQRVEQLAEHGITSLAIGIGADALAPPGESAAPELRERFARDVHAALREVQQLPIVQRWTQPKPAGP